MNSLRAGDLPIQATQLVGRRSEVEMLQVLLSKRRLITLVGSGGCGKTRLSIEVATTQLDRFENDVWFIDFSPLTAGEQVTQTVASVLSIKGDPQKPLLESLALALANSRGLLVLDNCEHLIDACAEFAAAILSHCPDIFIMATSRELLSVRGETMFRVPSLSLPEPNAHTAADVLKTDSGRLFLDRASLQLIDFTIDDENAAVVSNICARLDGIPLAIELAAAQVRTLSLNEILDSLNDCFRILTSGERGGLPRQRTIRATIEWSTNTLDPDLRRLLARLSVFSGGFTIEAVDAICGEGESQLPGLLALADKNLLLVRDAGKAQRRRLLETVRQYANKLLVNEGEHQQTARRHRDYFQQIASDARPDRHQDTSGWLERLSIDRNNLRAAIEWSLEQTDGLESALRMSADLGWYWYQQGQILEGCSLLSDGLAMPQDDVKPNTKLDALYTIAWLQNSMGMSQEATYRFKEMASLSIELGDRRHEAEALNGLGLVAYHQNYEQARSYFEEALELNRTLPDGGNSIANLNNLCLLSLSAGEYDAAHRYGEETVRLARQKSRFEVESVGLFLLAVNAEAMEQDQKASELYQEAEKLQRKHGLRQRLLHTLMMHADHCMDTDEAPSAQYMYREALDICQELRATTVEHQVLCGYGACLAARDRLGEARKLMAKGLELCKVIEDKGHLARAIEDATVYLVAIQEYETAARLLGTAWKQREEHPGMIHPNVIRRTDRLIKTVRDGLGESSFETLYAEGRQMTALTAIGSGLLLMLDPISSN